MRVNVKLYYIYRPEMTRKISKITAKERNSKAMASLFLSNNTFKTILKTNLSLLS